MIRGPNSFFNVPHVYVGGMYHVVYRNDESRELVVAIRTPTDGINWVTISGLIKRAQEDGIIAEGELSPDFSVDYWTGWETILAFDLAPCLELHFERIGSTTKYDYRVVTT